MFIDYFHYKTFLLLLQIWGLNKAPKIEAWLLQTPADKRELTIWHQLLHITPTPKKKWCAQCLVAKKCKLSAFHVEQKFIKERCQSEITVHTVRVKMNKKGNVKGL